jgi:uncharacterized protein
MTNRLAAAQSLYLRKHAENPIDWWPWCEEALATARRDDKPIFLSIGYSSCHWCTVMEGEAFSDAAIAAYMNAHFLPIKVDREERPDLDSLYMQTLQMITGQGGWPLNLFLAPDDQVPFYGGTYFPVEPKYGRPGFLQVLQTLRQFYDAEKQKVTSAKTDILTALQQSVLLPPAADFSQARLLQGLNASLAVLTPNDSPGPRFPMIPHAQAALQGLRFQAADLPEPAQRGLDLVLGGIYDHVGGGFHRYTVDASWTVPHFEKMLYDNGQIVEYLADLWRWGLQEPALKRAIEGTVDWLLREMTAPAGYFYAAQDADSFGQPEAAEPEEGAFYCWRYQQLAQLLSAEQLAALERQFWISEAGNFEGKIVLQRRQPGELEPLALAALDRLFIGRYGTAAADLAVFAPARDNRAAKQQAWPGRIPAVTDTKMIVAWNGLMISGLAKAAVALGQPSYLQAASRAARFILENQWQQQRLRRLSYDGTPAVAAQAEDYALLIKALLDMQQAQLAFPELPDAIDWLKVAVDLQAEFDQQLWSPEGGYYSASASDERLLVQERPFQDNATPAPNGVAIANLARLALLSEDLRYLDQAEQGLKAFGGVMEQLPRACPSLFIGLDGFRHSTLIRTQAERIGPLSQTYLPTAVFAVEQALPDDTVGLVCQGLTCHEPARSLEQLISQISQSLVRA